MSLYAVDRAVRTALALWCDLGLAWDDAIEEAATQHEVDADDVEWAARNPPAPDYDSDWWEIRRC